MVKKTRLDVAVYERTLAESRHKAQGMIMAGEVLVNGIVVDKPGTRVTAEDQIDVKSKPRYVSRGGEKLQGALLDFKLDVADLVCADVGASTGGFTDCLLQNGAAKVYAIDVGYGQIDYRLRQDERVVVMERTNARYLEQLEEPVDFVAVDASFISLRLLLPVIRNWLRPRADVVPLIKPQFEAGREDVGKGGVVRENSVHRRVLETITSFTHKLGFNVAGLTVSPITGPAGNVEFLAWLTWGKDDAGYDVSSAIERLTGE